MTDEERVAQTTVGMDVLLAANTECIKLGLPPAARFAFFLNVATHIGVEEMGMDMAKLVAVTMRCYGELQSVEGGG